VAEGWQGRSSRETCGYAFAAGSCRHSSDRARARSGTTYLPTPPKVVGGSGTGGTRCQARQSGGSAHGECSGGLAVGSSFLPAGPQDRKCRCRQPVTRDRPERGGSSASEGRGDRGGRLCKLRGAETADADRRRCSRSAAIPGRPSRLGWPACRRSRRARDGRLRGLAGRASERPVSRRLPPCRAPRGEEGSRERDDLLGRSGYCC